MKFKTIAALEAFRFISSNLTKEHPLQQLFWECTLRCSLKCQHCGSDCKTEATLKDMPLESFLSVLKQIKEKEDARNILIILTGGEPLCRPDIEKCGRAIYDLGFPWGLVTNGWFLTKEKLIGLISSGLHGMSISLDGLKEDHDWMRGREGSFERATNAIRMACEFNRACANQEDALGFSNLKPSDAFAFDVVTCVNKRNINLLPELRQHLISLGVKSWRLFTIFPVGRAKNNPELQLSPDQFHQLMEFIKKSRKEGEIHTSYACEGFLGPYEGEVRDYLFNCEAGITVGSVLSDGSISACPSIRSNYIQGSIYTDNFMEVWENRFSSFRDRAWMQKDDCKECRYWRWCHGGGMHLRDDEGNLILCHQKHFGL